MPAYLALACSSWFYKQPFQSMGCGQHLWLWVCVHITSACLISVWSSIVLSRNRKNLFTVINTPNHNLTILKEKNTKRSLFSDELGEYLFKLPPSFESYGNCERETRLSVPAIPINQSPTSPTFAQSHLQKHNITTKQASNSPSELKNGRSWTDRFVSSRGKR